MYVSSGKLKGIGCWSDILRIFWEGMEEEKNSKSSLIKLEMIERLGK